MKTANFPQRKNIRRRFALTRLQMQLKAGTKPQDGQMVELTDSDRKRIKKDIEILQSRIVEDASNETSKKYQGNSTTKRR